MPQKYITVATATSVSSKPSNIVHHDDQKMINVVTTTESATTTDTINNGSTKKTADGLESTDRVTSAVTKSQGEEIRGKKFIVTTEGDESEKEEEVKSSSTSRSSRFSCTVDRISMSMHSAVAEVHDIKITKLDDNDAIVNTSISVDAIDGCSEPEQQNYDDLLAETTREEAEEEIVFIPATPEDNENDEWDGSESSTTSRSYRFLRTVDTVSMPTNFADATDCGIQLQLKLDDIITIYDNNDDNATESQQGEAFEMEHNWLVGSTCESTAAATAATTATRNDSTDTALNPTPVADEGRCTSKNNDEANTGSVISFLPSHFIFSVSSFHNVTKNITISTVAAAAAAASRPSNNVDHDDQEIINEVATAGATNSISMINNGSTDNNNSNILGSTDGISSAATATGTTRSDSNNANDDCQTDESTALNTTATTNTTTSRSSSSLSDEQSSSSINTEEVTRFERVRQSQQQQKEEEDARLVAEEEKQKQGSKVAETEAAPLAAEGKEAVVEAKPVRLVQVAEEKEKARFAVEGKAEKKKREKKKKKDQKKKKKKRKY